MHASVYFIFGIFMSIYFFVIIYAILSTENEHIFSFCLCYVGVQICKNLNAENKMRDIGKGTYLVVENSENVSLGRGC